MGRFFWQKKQRPDLIKKIEEAEILQQANDISRRRAAELRDQLDATMASWDKRRKPINP